MSYEKLASEILEISSEQRLQILMIIADKKSKLSEISKKLDATMSEIHRNLGRLSKSKIITKDSDGNYSLTPYGIMICSQMRSWNFLISNKSYFSNHSFGNIPTSFILSIGSLEGSKHIKGYVKVQECWKNIYKNSSKYIYNMLHETSYDVGVISVLKKQIQSGINLRTLFSEDVIFPDERKQVLKQTKFLDLLKTDNIKRKIGKKLSVFVVFNESEASISFPTIDGEIDVSQVFYSKEKPFHDWCLGLYRYHWDRALVFREEKISK